MNARSLLWKSGQTFARIVTTLLFDLKVYGRENIPKHGGALILCNHQSYLDPVVVACQLRRPVSYFAKSELFENRIADWIIRALNGFPVRQGAGDIGAVKEAIHRLQEGNLLNIYPEGSRTKNGEMGPLQKGVALVVRRSRVPVVPAVIVGAFEAWPIQNKLWRPGFVRVRFGPPMDLAGLHPDEILATIDRTFRVMIDELRKHLPTAGQECQQHEK